MPYTSYHLITREDSDALYAYLMSREPIPKASPQTSLTFPFNLRFGLAFWNMLYKNRVQMQPAEGKSEEWQRGQYLVEALGHCGECHTRATRSARCSRTSAWRAAYCWATWRRA